MNIVFLRLGNGSMHFNVMCQSHSHRQSGEHISLMVRREPTSKRALHVLILLSTTLKYFNLTRAFTPRLPAELTSFTSAAMSRYCLHPLPALNTELNPPSYYAVRRTVLSVLPVGYRTWYCYLPV